jgi:hypothetical protein
MDYGGAIAAVALCNPDGAANRHVLRAHRNILTVLPPDVAVRLVCRQDQQAELADWIRRIGARGVTLVPVAAPLRPDALWVQDHLVVRRDRGRRTYVGIVSDHPYDTARWLGRADGVSTEQSRLHLSGGNVLVGRTFRILGAGSVEAEAGSGTPARRARALARHAAFDPRPLHLFGYSPDPEAPPLFQEPFHIDLALALTGCRTERGEPIVLLASPPNPSPELDDAAARLRRSGLHVIRNAAPVSVGGLLGYNNVLVENIVRSGERRPLVFMPQFGDGRPSLARFDDYALRLWYGLGFTPRPVPGWAPFIFPGGALRCATKILHRGPWRGPERTISDRTLRLVARLTP